MFLDHIRLGIAPTTIFKDLLLQNSTYTTDDLLRIFSDEFPNVTGAAYQTIWYWKYPGREKGMSDTEVDEALLYELKLAGYL
jgi:hypothetical protein